ncbi:MAG TPA: sugar phosphate isomerase/epimerase [Candidatus Brocadiia bacterium]|nr:sugar phosphate isomerase/epimerase [Candidatus Brocadiia bacterium]
MARIPIALQLYTVRDDAAKDYIGTLKKVAKMGYEGVEFAGYGGLSAKKLKKLIDDLGIKPAGTHCGMGDLQDNINELVDCAKTIGHKFITCPGMAGEYHASADGYKRAGEIFNEAGAKLKKEGITLCYHNHSAEFKSFDGKYGFDILFGAAKPANLKAELDLYWVKYGGEDPVKYIIRYAKRLPLIHLKDMANDEKRSFAEVGEGILDLDTIFIACQLAGAKWYIVEQDTCKGPPLESAKISIDNLRKRGMI